jgi:hypothetical protein
MICASLEARLEDVQSESVSSLEQNPSVEANPISDKKFPAFYGTLRFITAFKSVRHHALS